MRHSPPNKQAVLIFDNSEKETGGSIIRKPGSRKLYVLFHYLGRRVEKSTGLDDTPDHRDKVQTWLNHVIRQRNAGKLVFAEAFPGASEAEKQTFAKLEGRNYSPDPRDISMGAFIATWEAEVVTLFNHTKRGDYLAILNAWIKPYFADKTFFELTRLEVQKFIAGLKCKIGKNRGESVSRSRAVNVLTVLRCLFDDAVDQHHWDLPDPFAKVKRHLPKKTPAKRDIFRFDEWMQILDSLTPWYRPMAEFMILTGAIHSEISGLQRCDIGAKQIQFRRSIVRKVKNDTLKTGYRARNIPITDRIRNILDIVLVRTNSEYVFAEPDGGPYLREGFVEDYWMPALEKAGVRYRPPYSIRHSFAAWSLLVGIDPLRLVNLMGHGSKQMVFETYGNYLEGIEEDYHDILGYLGKDFVEYKKKPLSFYKELSSESPGESQGFAPHNQLITRR